jgi:hypothetical protein
MCLNVLWLRSGAEEVTVETVELSARSVAIAALACALLAVCRAAAPAQGAPPAATYPVGIRQLEFVDQDRHLALAVFHPAVLPDRAAVPFVMPFFTGLESYRDVEVASDGAPFPLVVFSHGRGSNGLYYAWFAEFLASRGYIVAALNHYRATPGTPRSLTSPTSSGSARSMSASPSVSC